MKKIIVFLLFGLSLILTSCDTPVEEVSFPEVIATFEEMFNIQDQSFVIEENIVLPNVVEGAILTYSSSDPSILDDSGAVVRPTNNDSIVTLSVTIKKGGNEQMIDYTVTITKVEDIAIVSGDFKIVTDQRVADGALVISGGNSSSNKQVIDDEFVSLGGGNENVNILIVPASSGGPTASAVKSMIDSYMGRYGLSENQFSVLQVTNTTKQLAEDPDEVLKVQQATAIWFAGGDQYLVTSALWRTDGTASLVLQAIFDKWEQGNIVIGGSSAGAAIMSRVMIDGGLSVGALTYDHVALRSEYNGDKYNYGALLVNETGFGFFEGGVVDQHFNTRDRLGRLIEASYVEGNKCRGFGIGENSSMIYNNTTKDIKVIGELVIVDTRNATRIKTSTNLSKYENVLISRLQGNSIYNLETEEFTFLREDGKPMEDRTTSPGNQYEYPTNISQFTGEYDSLMEFIAKQLLDNRKDFLHIGRDNLPYVSSYTIVDHEYYKELNNFNDKIIFEKRFYFDIAKTKVFYDAALKEYSFQDVILDIIPLEDNLFEQN